MKASGKVVVITGASSGIGEAAARLFRAEGAQLVLGDIDAGRGHALCDELGAEARFVRTDVAIEADVEKLVAEAVAIYGRLDVMFNNAGYTGPLCRIEDIEGAAFDQAYAVMVRGPAFGMKHAARVMCPQGGGSIVNTASIAGLTGGYGGHVYTAVKHALVGLTRSAALQLGARGIRVNALCPGGAVTPMNINAVGGGNAGRRMVEEHLSQMQPIPRPGQPEDMARAALFLASDDAAFVNGATLVVDGGAIAGSRWNAMLEGTL